MKKVLEITVDRNNEKWPWVFEHILIILHQAYDDYHKWFFGKKDFKEPSFSLEISKIWNRIQFFIISSKKYSNFLKNQIFSHYNNVEINEVEDYLAKIPDNKIIVGEVWESKHYLFPIKTFTELQVEWQKDMVDPYSSITWALARTGNYSLNSIQINFAPIQNKSWKKWSDKIVKILTSNYPQFIKNILLNDKYKYFTYLKYLFYPFIFLAKIFPLFLAKQEVEEKNNDETCEVEKKSEEVEIDWKSVEMPMKFVEKISSSGFKVGINIIHAGNDKIEWKMAVKEIASTLSVFARFGWNSFKLKWLYRWWENIKKRKISEENNFILNTSELSGLVHLPTNYVKTPQINWVDSRNFEPPANLPLLPEDNKKETDLTPVWTTNFRWTNLEFWIGPNDRRRHMYIIWKTGMWKSTLLENMIIDDIRKGRWVAVIDPHGDLAEAVIW